MYATAQPCVLYVLAVRVQKRGLETISLDEAPTKPACLPKCQPDNDESFEERLSHTVMNDDLDLKN